jgi:hypothetical protein
MKHKHLQKRLIGMLKEHGAVLKRQKNHHIYQLPNGHTLVISSTASDHRAEENNLHRLRRLLSLPPRGK